MDTGNTRLKCPTWLPCQRCVLGVRQKRETCLLRVAYIYILPLSVLSIRFDELHAFPSREIVLPLLQSTVSLSLMSKQQTPPPSVFIDSCRGNDTLYFPLSSPSIRRILLQSERNLLNRSSFRETSCRPRASRKPVDRSRFDFKHEEKRGGGKKAERKRATGSQRRRETVRFASRSERFRGCEITCNCVPRETIVQRKVTARADKKGAQLAPFSVRERTVFPLLSFSRTCPPFIFRPSEIKFYIHRP